MTDFQLHNQPLLSYFYPQNKSIKIMSLSESTPIVITLITT